MKRHGDGRRVKIDSRFKEMLTSDNFKVTYSVDSRGRPLAKKSESGVDIEKYYHLSDSDDDGNDIHGSNDDDDDASERVPKIKKLKRDDVVKKSPLKIKTLSPKKPNIKNNDDIDDDDDDDDDDDSSDDDDKAHSNRLIKADYDDDDDDNSDSSSNSISHPWGEIDREAAVMENPTRRLAVCNMDWDRIKSVDLMVLFSSFKPEGGIIKSISIYPSDFGLERMKEEEWKGPKELTEKSDKVKLLDEASSEKYFKEKLRLYQLNRLKYFYAVLECDSVSTADAIYSNCNAMEYERSSTVLDLRFIPDDMTFDDRDPTSVCTSLPPKGSYKPTIFVNTALHQSNVQLTWDETPQERQAVLMADFTKKELHDDEIKHYLASSSDEEAAATDDDDDDGATDDNGGCDDDDATASTTAAAREDDDDDDAGDDDDDFFIASSKCEESQCDEVNNKAKGKDGNKNNNNNNKNNNKNKNNIEGESNGRKNKLNSNVNLYVSLLNELNDGKPNSRRKDGDDDDDDDVHMEVTWEPGLKEAAEVMVKENQKSKLTNWEQYLEKRREKRKLRKKFKREATRKQKNNDDDEDDNVTKDSKNKQKKSRDKKLKKKNQPVKERELTESEKADLELLMMDVDGDDGGDVSRNGDDPKIRSKKKLKKMKKMKEDQATEVSDSRFSKIHSDPKFSDKAEKRKKEKPKY
ncbi:hypothetical protein HELRODRAFT_113446 [Helobdella robusta]|uniref:ESF1 RRM domain-containing protein n=1 Tax=Helobdella robusta TaxID=6412 RepID=T1EFS6_HELRO|nr:hypothetical protein HELRODRAFT_113446 [Helobdella robusta]ESO00059.1 hypothetical protein HELRODRAFT_113446 [Helobdella robusta]